MVMTTWLIVCMTLLAISWGLMLFRKRLIKIVARYPRATRVIAIVLATFLGFLAFMPFLVMLFY